MALPVGQFDAEDVAAAVQPDADGDHHRLRADHAVLARHLVAGVQDQVRHRLVELALCQAVEGTRCYSLAEDAYGVTAMTAEVALLNRKAVALAADSAMTLGGSGKIYPAQKLFALPKGHAVGVMIYNNAEFMGIPWETLIKMYGSSLGGESRSTVEDYVEEFLEFIVAGRFITAEQEFRNLREMVEGLLITIRDDATEQGNGVDSLKARIERFRKRFQEAERARSMTNDHVTKFLRKERSRLNERIEHIFDEFDPTAEIKRLVVNLVGDVLKRNVPTPQYSGLVMAGFGREEFFPTMIAVNVEGTVGGRLKHRGLHRTEIGRDGLNASIMPFAQREMVERFMEGVDPSFLEYVGDTMSEASTQLTLETLKALGIKCTNEQEEAVRHAALEQTKEYLKQAEKFKEKEFVNPIMEIVGYLPQEELANMAEAMVNLTALKRRVSLEAETVGGPIDVAVITKGDGFTWIRRKNYFDPAINRS